VDILTSGAGTLRVGSADADTYVDGAAK
ncbi:hypothetical protein KIPB_008162, partial [Kipferlia bialata]